MSERGIDARRIIAQAPLPIALFRGAHHSLELANPAWHELFGDHTGPPALNATGAAFDDCFQRGEAQRLPQQPIGLPAPVRHVALALVPWRTESGDVIGVAAYATDVTQEVALRESSEEAQRERDRFLNVLAHELRSPMAPILTAIDLYRLDHSGKSTDRALRIIERQSRSLLQRIDNLLDVSRAARGKLELSPSRVDVCERVRAGVDIARYKTEQRQQTLTVDAEDSVFVFTDPKRIAHVVANLVDNAAIFTDPGGAIHVTCREEQGRAVVRVRDTGRGLRPDDIRRIFEPFVQGADASTGLGLGLAFVRKIVESSGGGVTAHSDGPGRGSEFVIELPIHRG